MLCGISLSGDSDCVILATGLELFLIISIYLVAL